MGGLGNQMFQYALGRVLSEKNHTRLVIDLSHLENQPVNETPREYELDCFDIKGEFSHEPVLTEEQPRKFLIKKKHYTPYYEQGFTFKKSVLDLQDQTLLIGYWQTSKYFKGFENMVKRDFKFTKPLSKAKQKILEKIEADSGAVALQIRRGDYVSNPSSKKFHGLASMAYYVRAVKYISNHVKNPTFYVITDDPAWCKRNIKLGYPTVFVSNVSNGGWEDMYLMSRCRHQIIANSSFGWWAAWLNDSKKKIVIAPKTWAIEKTADYSDVAPKNWVRL
jgi:hypothetical protein